MPRMLFIVVQLLNCCCSHHLDVTIDPKKQSCHLFDPESRILTCLLVSANDINAMNVISSSMNPRRCLAAAPHPNQGEYPTRILRANAENQWLCGGES